ncbi:hypothetical protein G6F50_016921 [Rhizopus delemar]|uniref:Uncharacterized protein n=1 Tax=Rhizopus delemar TaxID=936053 RepID=A0A9P6XRH6_9FUNG|nr:hypothetical protein G6F50_016921 [Rhizopus delemar]
MHFAAWRARGVDRGQADAVLLEHIQQLTQRTGPVFCCRQPVPARRRRCGWPTTAAHGMRRVRRRRPARPVPAGTATGRSAAPASAPRTGCRTGCLRRWPDSTTGCAK